MEKKIRFFFQCFLIYFIIKGISYYDKLIKNKHKSKVKYLFVNFGQIGDLVISSILFDLYEKNINSKNICLLVDEKFIKLFEDYSGDVKIFSINFEKYVSSFRYKLKIILSLRMISYEQIYNLTSSRRILTDSILYLLDYKELYCFNDNWKKSKSIFQNLFNKRYKTVFTDTENNEYNRHFLLFNKIFKKNIKYEIKNDITFSNNVKNSETYIIIAPFASSALHSWPLSKYIDLCRLLSNEYKIIIVGNKNDFEVSRDIFSNINNVVNLAGKTNLLEVAYLISNAKLFIGNDSGLTHIAFKLGTPLIGIIGGGAFGYYFPFGQFPNNKFIFNKLDCFNCNWVCKYKTPYCLDNISVDNVYKECLTMLKKINV